MRQLTLRRGFSFAALAAAAVLASCATPEPEAPPAPPPPPPPPPVTLNESVADAASIYVTFMRDVATIQAGGFTSAEAIQEALRKGATYEPNQLSRGMIAYASILALQSPEFVAGVRAFAADPVQRREIVGRIIADPAYAATFPGADSAAGLIAATIGKEVGVLGELAEAVEGDAYTIQERRDPRRRWAIQANANRAARLEGAKDLSDNPMLPSAEESARLLAAAHAGNGLGLEANRISAPYTPAVANALAIAALAALGAAGDDARINTDALVSEPGAEFCLNMSKLMLFQCLAAARPAYEDMFCLGRHVVRDLATCASQGTRIATSSVSAPVVTDTTLTQTPVAVEVPVAATTPPQS
ncbi:hypothetical protein [Brevundimonas sp.]|uniref:hypothetical protein n=1 Tax=Brevundimonas sp. TaxID=1871086 RepID=UPI0025BFD27E|nr:hypothetical protein [Brevundimonas sp.]